MRRFAWEKLHFFKLQIFVTLLAAAYAIEDTAEVAAAKEAFMAAFAKAEAGEHAALAPAAVATAYLADEPEVAAAKAEFMKVFDAYKNGEIPAPVAPAAPVVEAAAPVFSYAAYPQYYNNWNYGAFYNNWAGYGAYPYAHAAYPYAHAGYPYAYAGYPYTVQVAPAKAE